MNLLTKGANMIAGRLARAVPDPLGMECIIPVPTAEDLEKRREQRARNIVCMQAEGSVLLSAGSIDMHGFDLFEGDDDAVSKDDA